MAEFLWALRFLTIIPIRLGWEEEIQPQRTGVVMSLFPLVGLIIGLLLVLVYIPLVKLFPVSLADALVIVTFIVITGALHLDGLADSADGILGGWDASRRLEIMKDSRIGVFGVLSLLIVLGLKYLSFHEIGGYITTNSTFLEAYLPVYDSCAEKATILLMLPVVGRWSQVLAAGIYSYARNEPGTAWALINNTHLRHSIVASIVPILLAGFLLGEKGLIITAILAGFVLIQASYINVRIGGLTGDTLGAINEVTELLFLLLLYII